MAKTNTQRTAKRRAELKKNGLKELTGIVVPSLMSKSEKNELRLHIEKWIKTRYQSI